MKKIELYDQTGYPIEGLGLVREGTELMTEIMHMGYTAYIVGGCVRDMLMGKLPHDVDIATNMPIDVIKQHFKTIEYGGGERHGTVIVHYRGNDFELTQFRSESTYSDNRRPDEVVFVDTFEEDSKRRDFTINAMGINFKGEVIDYHGGLEDIENKIIRTVGNANERFAEDSLRILRAARFAARMDFKIHEDTEIAMRELADTINNVSDERIRDEFEKSMNVGVTFGKFLRYLTHFDIVNKIFPSFKTRSLSPVCRAKSTDSIVNFSLMFSSVSNPDLVRLKLPKNKLKAIEYCLNSHYVVHNAHISNTRDSIGLLVKIFIDNNFHYLIDFYHGYYNEALDFDVVNRYKKCVQVYDLDKEVNAYIHSKGITGTKFGHVINDYYPWVFEYFYDYNVLPLDIEWKSHIDNFINQPSTQLFWGKTK